jgi:hypothetical protein
MASNDSLSKGHVQQEGTIIKYKLGCNGLPLYDMLVHVLALDGQMNNGSAVCASTNTENVQHFIAECGAYVILRQDLLVRMGADALGYHPSFGGRPNRTDTRCTWSKQLRWNDAR